MLAPVSSKTPPPALVSPSLPASTVEIFTLVVAVIVGAVASVRSSVRMLGPERTQLEPAAALSEKVRLPMVRAESSVTVRVAVMLLVKLAVKPTPSATVPLDQLVVGVLQFPPAS